MVPVLVAFGVLFGGMTWLALAGARGGRLRRNRMSISALAAIVPTVAAVCLLIANRARGGAPPTETVHAKVGAVLTPFAPKMLSVPRLSQALRQDIASMVGVKDHELRPFGVEELSKRRSLVWFVLGDEKRLPQVQRDTDRLRREGLHVLVRASRETDYPIRALFQTAERHVVYPGPPKDGQFSPWTQFTPCVPEEGAPCVEGKQEGFRRRSRRCVPPQNGGMDCVGEAEQRQACVTDCSCKVQVGECGDDCKRRTVDAHCVEREVECDEGACKRCEYGERYGECQLDCTARAVVVQGGERRSCEEGAPTRPCALSDCGEGCDRRRCCARHDRDGLKFEPFENLCVAWEPCRVADASCADGKLTGTRRGVACHRADGSPCSTSEANKLVGQCDTPCAPGWGAWGPWTDGRRQRSCSDASRGLTRLGECRAVEHEPEPGAPAVKLCERPYFRTPEGECTVCPPGTYRDWDRDACVSCAGGCRSDFCAGGDDPPTPCPACQNCATGQREVRTFTTDSGEACTERACDGAEPPRTYAWRADESRWGWSSA